jgi:TPR repeat protein
VPHLPRAAALWELGYRVWAKLNRALKIDGEYDGTWRELSASQQGEIDGAIVMLQEAMDQVSGVAVCSLAFPSVGSLTTFAMVPASHQGHIEVAELVGIIYYWGQGVTVDYPRAIAAYKVGAEGGDAGYQCQWQVGVMYFTGRGVDVDYKNFHTAASVDVFHWPRMWITPWPSACSVGCTAPERA